MQGTTSFEHQEKIATTSIIGYQTIKLLHIDYDPAIQKERTHKW